MSGEAQQAASGGMYSRLSTSSRFDTALCQRENLQSQCQNVSKILFRYFAVKGTESQELHRRLNPLDVHKEDVFALRVRCRCSTSGAVRTAPLPLPG